MAHRTINEQAYDIIRFAMLDKVRKQTYANSAVRDYMRLIRWAVSEYWNPAVGGVAPTASVNCVSFNAATKTIVVSANPRWIAGDVFTVANANTAANNGTYVVESITGVNVVVENIGTMVTDATAAGTAHIHTVDLLDHGQGAGFLTPIEFIDNEFLPNYEGTKLSVKQIKDIYYYYDKLI